MELLSLDGKSLSFLLISLLAACSEFTDSNNIGQPVITDNFKTQNEDLESFDALRIAVDFPTDGLSLGEGFDVLRGERAFNSCVENYLIASESSTNHDLTFKSINSEVDIQRTQRSSISAGGGIGQFSASASRKSSKSYRLQSNSQKVLVNLEIKGETFYVVPRDSYATANNLKLETNGELQTEAESNKRTDFRLTNEAIQLLNRDVGDFFNYCGSGFTSSFHTGGKMEALIQRTNTTKTTKRSLAVDVAAGFGGFSASGGTSESVKEKHFLENLTIDFTQQGGLGGEMPTSIEGLSEAIGDFGDSVSQDYSITSAEIVPYYNLILNDDRVAIDKSLFKKFATNFDDLMALVMLRQDLAKTIEYYERTLSITTSGRDPRSPGTDILDTLVNIPYQFVAFNLGDYNLMINELDDTILSFRKKLRCIEDCLDLDRNEVAALYYSVRQYIPGHLNQGDYVNVKVPTQIINRGQYLIGASDTTNEYRNFVAANEKLRKIKLLQFYKNYSEKQHHFTTDMGSKVYKDPDLKEIIETLKNDRRLDLIDLDMKDEFGDDITLRGYLVKLESGETDANTDVIFYTKIDELLNLWQAEYLQIEQNVSSDIRWSTINSSSYKSSDLFFEWIVWNFELESFRACSRNNSSFLCVPNGHKRKYIEQTLFPIIFNGKYRYIDTDEYGTGQQFYRWKEMSKIRSGQPK